MHTIVRGIVAGFFVLAAAGKLAAPGDFAGVIADYGIVYEGFELPAAFAVATAELLAGIGVWFRWRGALGFLAVLLALLTGVLLYGMHLGLDVDCGCLGFVEQRVEIALARNVVLGLACAYLFWARPSRNDS